MGRGKEQNSIVEGVGLFSPPLVGKEEGDRDWWGGGDLLDIFGA